MCVDSYAHLSSAIGLQLDDVMQEPSIRGVNVWCGYWSPSCQTHTRTTKREKQIHDLVNDQNNDM